MNYTYTIPGRSQVLNLYDPWQISGTKLTRSLADLRNYTYMIPDRSQELHLYDPWQIYNNLWNILVILLRELSILNGHWYLYFCLQIPPIELTGFNMYAEYTRPQLTFLALVPWVVLKIVALFLVRPSRKHDLWQKNKRLQIYMFLFPGFSLWVIKTSIN